MVTTIEAMRQTIRERLARPIPAGQVGVVNRRKAEWIGNAAAVAGGFVATGSVDSYRLQEALGNHGWDDQFVCMPISFGQRTVARRVAAEAVREDLRVMSSATHLEDGLDRDIADSIELLDMIESEDGVMISIPETYDAAIDALVELDVARWGEGEREASRRLHRSSKPTYGLALNSLAHRAEYDYGDAPQAQDLVDAANRALTPEDRHSLGQGG
jgi:hypothetical protein